MKKILLLMLVCAPLLLLGQVGITITFGNSEIVSENDSLYYEFDVMANGNTTGTYIQALQFFVVYNPLAFGEGVWNRGHMSYSRGTLAPGPNYETNQNDSYRDTYSIGTYLLFSPVELPLVPTQVIRIRMKIIDPTQSTGISLDSELMEEQQYYLPAQVYVATTTDVLDETLPIELSSFTATLSSVNLVTLQWITQSETNVSGYRIYRNIEADAGTAAMLNVFIPGTNSSQMQVYMFTDEEVDQDGTYYYWLENLDMDGSSTLHGPISISVSFAPTGPPTIPIITGIEKAYPNPFHPAVNLSLSVDKNSWVDLDIYNLKGQRVRSLFSGNMEKGNKSFTWDARDSFGTRCANGLYLATMRTNGQLIATTKLILAK